MACCDKDEVLGDPCQAITDGVLSADTYASFGLSTGEWLKINSRCQVTLNPPPPQLNGFNATYNTANGPSVLSLENQIKIPTVSGSTYACDVDWGDGNIELGFNTWDDPRWLHTYSAPGIYQVRIEGTFCCIRFSNGEDVSKLVSIDKWGDVGWDNLVDAFYGCENLVSVATATTELDSVVDATNAFRETGLLGVPDITLGGTTTADFMFAGCLDLTTTGSTGAPLLASAEGGFDGCVSLLSLNAFISAANITSLSKCWRGTGLTSIPNMSVPVCLDMSEAFADNLITNIASGLGSSLGSVTDFTDFLRGSTVNTDDYSAFLVGLETANQNNNVVFSGGNSQYNEAGYYAREALIVDHSWIITDGGGWSPTGGFRTSWKTDNAGTSNSTSITVPTVNGATYNCTVDWGDGSIEVITAWDDPRWTHDYGVGNEGTYEVIFRNVFERIRFNNGGDRLKLVAITDWGDVGFTSMESAFYGCANLEIDPTATAGLETITDFTNAFRTNTGSSSFPLLDMSAATDITRCWNGNSTYTAFPLLLLPNVTTAEGAWFNCSGVTVFPDIVFTSCLNFKDTWRGMTGLTVSPAIDLSLATNVNSMFRDCTGITTQAALTGLNAAVDASYAFRGCSSLVTAKAFNFSAATNLSYTYANCLALTTLPAGLATTMGAATDMSEMFDNVTLDTADYNQFLIDLEAANAKSNITFDGGGSIPDTTGLTARNALTSRGWIITDGYTAFDFETGVTSANLIGWYEPGPDCLNAGGQPCSDAENIVTWLDKSSAGNDLSSSVLNNQPVYMADGGAEYNNAPVAEFLGEPKVMNFADGIFTALTGAEMFELFDLPADPPPSLISSGFMRIGADPTLSDHMPLNGTGVIYNGFGSTARKTCGVWPGSMTNPTICNIWSAPSDWGMILNDDTQFTTTSNTVGFATQQYFGASENASYRQNGNIRIFLMYDGELSPADRASVKSAIQEMRTLP